MADVRSAFGKNRGMRTVLVAALFLGLMSSGVSPATADTTILEKTDERGDVRLFEDTSISKRKKRSIDIDRASVVQLDSGRIRFKVRIRKIHRSKRWDQIVVFSSGVHGGGETQSNSVVFTTRNRRGAYAYDSRTDANCSLRVKRKRRTVWVDVPRRCAPSDGDTVDLGTITSRFRSDENAYSMDLLRLGVFRSPA